MKRILFLINTLSGGGAEKVLTDLVNHLDFFKYDVTLQTIQDVGVHKCEIGNNVSYKSIVKTRNPFFRKVLSYLISFVIPPKAIHQIYIRSRYDMEIAYLEGLPTKIIGSVKNNAAKLAFLHTNISNNYGLEKLFHNIDTLKECYQRFDQIICVSEDAKKGFLQKVGISERIQVLHNVIDPVSIIAKADERSSFDRPTTKLLLSVGRLVYQKGFDRMMTVISKLVSEGFDFKYWIIGEGDEKTNLVEQVKQAGIENTVRFLGYQKNPYPYMKNADIFICCSREEGYSTVVAEALIFGKTIISTNCSGMNELLGYKEAGLIVENNEEGLYNGLKMLLSDEFLCANYADRARQCSMQFSLNKQINDYMDFFDRTLIEKEDKNESISL